MSHYTGSVGVQGGLKPLGDYKLVSMDDVYQPAETVLSGTVKAGTMYFLGEITSLTFSLPATADKGDMVYVSFYTGSQSPTVTVSSSNHIGLGTEYDAACHYELMGVWNGKAWVFVTHRVDL